MSSLKRMIRVVVVVLFSSVWTLPALAVTWQARHGLTNSEYQSEFEKWTDEGYRLTLVSGYEDNGRERYVAAWMKESGPAWVAKHGLSASAYQKAFNDYSKKGYRLTLVNGYEVKGADGRRRAARPGQPSMG